MLRNWWPIYRTKSVMVSHYCWNSPFMRKRQRFDRDKSASLSCSYFLQGRYYIRSGATNQRLSGHALESFIWTSVVRVGQSAAARFTLDKLVIKRLNILKNWQQRKVEYLQTIWMSQRKSAWKTWSYQRWVPDECCDALFSEDPQRWQQGAYVKIGFFRNHADLEYQDEIRGPLIDQIDRIIEVIHLKYMKARITYEAFKGLNAICSGWSLKRTILNAICHKDYSRSIPIQISVYDDQLYIGNVGRLPEHWTIDDL